MRHRMTGIHRAPFLGVEPTNRWISYPGQDIIASGTARSSSIWARSTSSSSSMRSACSTGRCRASEAPEAAVLHLPPARRARPAHGAARARARRSGDPIGRAEALRAGEPTTVAARPLTGGEYLDSLNDGREVWIYGKRVENIVEHPAFRNTARMIARLYDALHADHREKKGVTDLPDRMGRFHPSLFRGAALGRGSGCRARRDRRLGAPDLWLARPRRRTTRRRFSRRSAPTPSSTSLQENARRWYRFGQERVLYVNHAIVHPPVDRNMAPGAPGADRHLRPCDARDRCRHLSSPAPRSSPPARR